MQQQTGTPSCLGRDTELAKLDELYREAQVHGERLALLEGPSGAGKTGILREFRSRIRLAGGVVLEGHCQPAHAFGPFAEIVERALKFLEEVDVEPSARLDDLACQHGCHQLWYQHGVAEAPHPLPAGIRLQMVQTTSTEADPFEKRLRFFEAVLSLLRDVSRVRAPVVLLHDLQRADQGTLQLLQYLLDGSGPGEGPENHQRLRALFVADLRAEAPVDGGQVEGVVEHRNTRRIRVAELDLDGVRAYLQSPDVVGRILQRTGGLPEAIDLLLEADPLTPEGRLEKKLEALPEGARALVEALAVFAQPADVELLAAIALRRIEGPARTDFSHCDLITRTIIDGQMLFGFARDRDRERIQGLLPEDERRLLHQRSMQVLEQIPDQVRHAAHHALKAGHVERAVPLALEAARSLSGGHAHAEAAVLLEELVAAGGQELPIDVRAYLAELYRLSGEYRLGIAHARAVVATTEGSAAASRTLGELLTLAGSFSEATAALERARSLAAAASDQQLVAEAEARLAELQYQRASYDDALTWANSVLQVSPPAALALDALNTIGKVHLARQRPSEAAETFAVNAQRAHEAGLGHHEAQALTNLGVARLGEAKLEEAEELFTRAAEVATRSSDTRDRAIATENLAVLAHMQNDYGRAQGLYHEAVTLLRRLGNRPMLARVANNLGELYLSMGDVARARTLCDFATHVGGVSLPRSIAAEGMALRGRIDLVEGNTAAARAALEAALKSFEAIGERRAGIVKVDLAGVALAEGKVREAREWVANAPLMESPKRAAKLAQVMADIERAAGTDALPAARRAVELAEAADDEELLLPALLRLAQAHADAGQAAAAGQALHHAHEIESALTDRIPEEALTAWSTRPVRGRLLSVEEAVVAAGAGSATQRRKSSRKLKAVGSARDPRWDKAYPDISGSSDAVGRILGLLDKVAPTDAMVLIRGESGTGKELIAEALHRNSPRHGKALVKVNCAALVETLLLSELFGHERGAFTGAQARKKGRFEMADGGSIFLDEIGDISPKTQVALLRVLQEREFERVGGTQPIKVNVRIIAATHRDLEQMVRDGAFREDLYYRLRGVMIEMPPLRGHVEDLPELANRLLARIADERGEAPREMSSAALRLLCRHRWPGNVRELENVLRSATLFAESPVLGPQDFAAFADSFQMTDDTGPAGPAAADPEGAAPDVNPEDLLYRRIKSGEHGLLEMKKEIERVCIVRALEETDGNITQAATLLGMKRPRLSQLVKQYELQAKGG